LGSATCPSFLSLLTDQFIQKNIKGSRGKKSEGGKKKKRSRSSHFCLPINLLGTKYKKIAKEGRGLEGEKGRGESFNPAIKPSYISSLRLRQSIGRKKIKGKERPSS